VTEPAIGWLALPAGRFRALEWPVTEPPVLFLHGLIGIAEVWQPTIARFAKPHPRCIAIDQRGHGHSPKPAADYSAGRYARDLTDALDALGLDRVHLVGHSMGARVAMVGVASVSCRAYV
jgi:pimeloyl-ACP methyl ester carboxylesterase